MPTPLDPVIDKFIAALEQDAGGIKRTILERKIRDALARWLQKNIAEIVRAVQPELLDQETLHTN